MKSARRRVLLTGSCMIAILAASGGCGGGGGEEMDGMDQDPETTGDGDLTEDPGTDPAGEDISGIEDVPGPEDVEADEDGGDPGPCLTPSGVEYGVQPEPSVSLPPAGGFYVDPTFGTKVIRVTDETAGGDCYHAYSYWPVFNADSTGLHLSKAGTPTIYSIDPDTDAILELGPLFPGGVNCNWEDSAWSHSDPDVLYCHTTSPKRVYAYDVTVGGPEGLTLLADFDGDLPGDQNAYLWQMLVDKSDEVFTFHTRDDGGGTHNAIAWVRSTDERFYRDYTGEGLDETHVDHAGETIVAQLDGRWDVWNFREDTVVTVNQTAEERGGLCHQIAGSGIYVGGDCWETGYLARPLASPLEWTHLVSFYEADGETLQWGFDVHLSLNHSDERWFITSPYTSGGADPADWSPWEQEILGVAVDGSFVVRLAHHHSDYTGGGYWASPRVSTSFDGRYAAFTSNFDGGRLDVFVLRLPRLCD